MANPELGTKQLCPNCQAKFYDLGKRPAVCPKCQTAFDPDEAVRSRRVRARTAAPLPDDDAEDQVKGRKDDDEDEEEEAVTPEIDEAIESAPLVGDDEEDEDGEPVGAPGGDDLTEFSDDEEIEDDADVPFLVEDEDDDFDETEIEGLPEEGDEDR